MIRNYGIGNRAIAISTQQPDVLRADALILPWSGAESPRPPSPVLKAAGSAVLAEILEYDEGSEVMLTSAGALPQRFLFHLSLPGDEKVALSVIEDRLRDCFFQAGVLGLREVAIAILDFSPYVESFSDLVARVWTTSREFLTRERGPHRLLLLIDDRDLRGQYLRHFLDRKQAEDRRWEVEEPVLATPLPPGARLPRQAVLRAPGQGTEQVLSLELCDFLPDPDSMAGALVDLLEDYRLGRDMGESRLRLIGPMAAAFAAGMAQRGEERIAGEHLRILGSPLALRLPWELLPGLREGVALGEGHLLTRGTNFLHFRRRNLRPEPDGLHTSLRVVGESGAARRLAQGIQELVETRGLEVYWSTEQEATARIIHCLDAPALESLLDEGRPDCELVVLELPPGADGAGAMPPAIDPLGERAGVLLAHGCRHVLAPLAPFREVGERDAFRSALYERLFGGATVGESLQYAQRVLMESQGLDAGWWLYRLFGQTDSALLPARARLRDGATLVTP